MPDPSDKPDPFVAEYLLGAGRSRILRTLIASSARSWSVAEMQHWSGVSDVVVRKEMNALSRLGLLTCTRQVPGPSRYKVMENHPAVRALGELVAVAGDLRPGCGDFRR